MIINDKRTIIKKLNTILKHCGNYEPTWKEKEEMLFKCSDIGSNDKRLNYLDNGVFYNINPNKASNDFIKNVMWSITNIYSKDNLLYETLLDIKFQCSEKGEFSFEKDNNSYKIKIDSKDISIYENNKIITKIKCISTNEFNIELLKIIDLYDLVFIP